MTAAQPDTPAQQLSLGLGAMTMSAHSGQGRTRIHPSVSPGLVACRPQARGSCASGYTGTATTFGPGRDGDERALGPGEDPGIPVHLPLPWWRVVQEKEIPRSLDPAKAFVDVDGAARSLARAEVRQLAPDVMAPLAQQPSHYPEEGVWSSLLHQK